MERMIHTDFGRHSAICVPHLNAKRLSDINHLCFWRWHSWLSQTVCTSDGAILVVLTPNRITRSSVERLADKIRFCPPVAARTACCAGDSQPNNIVWGRARKGHTAVREPSRILESGRSPSVNESRALRV